MDHTRWRRVPLGPESPRWRTFGPSTTALVVVRTQTTVSWLFDLLPDLLGDQRIQVVFTVNGEGSAFEPGVAELVDRMGGVLVPWDQAIDMRFDIAISASFRGGLDQLNAPLLVLPHGPGYTRMTGTPTANWSGSITPVTGTAVVALTHPNQRSIWAGFESERVTTAVVGDPCFDVLRASRGRASRYREALGVRPDQRLVVMSSTWGPGSLIARRPTILEELATELPTDSYVIAAILHPNVWVAHGRWQLRTWLRAPLDGGIRLIPHVSGWRATMVAADFLIGDQGSVTFYGACLGVPTLLGSFAGDELVPMTPLADVGRRVPPLAGPGERRNQIESVGFRRDPGRYADLVDRSFAHRGQAMDRLRALVYRMINLPAPTRAREARSAPDPDPEVRRTGAHRVVARCSRAGRGDSQPEFTVERFPACCREPADRAMVDDHLATWLDEPDVGLVESASVLLCPDDPDGGPHPAAVDRRAVLRRVLGRYPGALVAIQRSGPDSALAVIRRGPDLLVTAVAPGVEWIGAVGSVLYLISISAGRKHRVPRFVTHLGAVDVAVAIVPLTPTTG